MRRSLYCTHAVIRLLARHYPVSQGGFSVLVLTSGCDCLHHNEGSIRGDCMILECRGKWGIMPPPLPPAEHSTRNRQMLKPEFLHSGDAHVEAPQKITSAEIVDDVAVYSWLWPQDPMELLRLRKVIAKVREHVMKTQGDPFFQGLQTSYLLTSTIIAACHITSKVKKDLSKKYATEV